MTILKVNQEDIVQLKKTKAAPVIDTDIHERFTSLDELIPYLEEPWKGVLVNKAWNQTTFPYALLTPGGAARLDSFPPNGAPGSDYELLREQLLDKYNIQYGILTGSFYLTGRGLQPEFRNALATAYNNWLIEHWLSKDDRFRGSVYVNYLDPVAAADEIDRIGKHPQMVQVMLRVNSDVGLGEKRFHPIYEAAERSNLRIAFHVGGEVSRTAIGYPTYFTEYNTCFPQGYMSQVVSLIVHGVFNKYPGLKVMMLEGGFTWLPHLMWRFDISFRANRRETPWLDRMPSEYIRDHFCFNTQPMEDPDPKHMLQIVEMIGSDKILVYASDYPHWDFDDPNRCYPHTFSHELKRKLLYENAREFYGLDASEGRK